MFCEVIPPLDCQNLTFSEMVDYVNLLEQRRFDLCETVENFEPPVCTPDQPIEQFSVTGLTVGDWPQPVGYPNSAGEFTITLANSYDLSKTYVFDRGGLNDKTAEGGGQGYNWEWVNIVAGFSNQIRFIADVNNNTYFERLDVSVMQSSSISTQHINLTSTDQVFSIVSAISPFVNIDNAIATPNLRGRQIRAAGGPGQARVRGVVSELSGTSASPTLTVSGDVTNAGGTVNISVQVSEFGV